ncbi:MAG: 4-hydroxy-3-methylbut-2-enyl diphosphate reductase [Candidatus Omnitrophica bacterium]|nr:4-hydroxy-3-methylbut-2-enyl diphosphate reductase [Candidatus Omnitrophota bacterium]
MKVHIGQHSGFCFGVKRAIQVAKEAARLHKNIYIKGELVHNQEVCRQIEALGIKTVSTLKSVPGGSVLIIKAHGEPLATYINAKRKKIKVIDATCPMVKDIHKKAKEMEQKGFRVAIIGDKNHEETIGILGNIKNGSIVENIADLRKLKSGLGEKIGVVCQSTQNIEDVSVIVAKLAKITHALLFFNTVCRPTYLRQKEIERLAKNCSAVLVVGSKNSANTKRLFFIAKKINPNTFWVNNAKSIAKNSFKKFGSVGVIGGASTPPETLEEVYKKLS